LYVGFISPDSDEDDLLDVWELMFFPVLSTTDGSIDSDGDGQSDAAEFLAKTNPIDPLDVLRITSVRQAASGDVIVSWTSKVGVSYGVRMGDLSIWAEISNGHEGTDGELDFTDDGMLSGGAPGADDERYYQVFVE
jgi:hypothetical protein